MILFLLQIFLGTLWAESIEHTLTSPLSASKLHLFHLNPAISETKSAIVNGAYGQGSKTMTFNQTSNPSRILKSDVKRSFYGLAVLTDIGAGAAIGGFFNEERNDTTSSSTIGSREVSEAIKYQTYGGHVLIELTKNVVIGLQLKFLNETADTVGTFNNTEDRITYSGFLSGYTSGLIYKTADYKFGGSYQPPFRGKAQILLEDKILTEPGYTFVHGQFLAQNFAFGVSYLRWLHQRDERATSTLGIDGKTQVNILGQDFDRQIFPLYKYGISGGYSFSPGASLMLSYLVHTDTFLLDPSQTPDDSNRDNIVNYGEIKIGASFEVFKWSIEGGYTTTSRAHNFAIDLGLQGDYKATQTNVFLLASRNL